MEMKWYIVYTKPGLEKKLSETLTRKKIENYSPVNNTLTSCNDNKKIKNTSLFKGYVFVKTTDSNHAELKKLKGVVNFLYWMGKPVTIRNYEIKAIRLFLSEYTNVTVEKTAIKIDSNGATDNYSSEQELPMIVIKNKKASVCLPSLGYIMSAEVETSNVRIISAERTLDSENVKQNKLFNRVSEINNSLRNYWVKAFILSICILLVSK